MRKYYVKVKIEAQNLLDMLHDRLYDVWTKDKDVLELYDKYYEDLVYGDVFDGMELDIPVIVDNDYNNTHTFFEGDDEYEEMLENANGSFELGEDYGYGQILEITRDGVLVGN